MADNQTRKTNEKREAKSEWSGVELNGREQKKKTQKKRKNACLFA